MTVRSQIRTFVDDPSFTPHEPEGWFNNNVREKWLKLVPRERFFYPACYRARSNSKTL